MQNIFFNACHAPVGAFASLTLGCPGSRGGLGLELGRAPGQDLYFGAESHTPRVFEALPFYAMRDWDEEAHAHKAPASGVLLKPFARGVIRRVFQTATDEWRAGDLTVRILSPVQSIPNPAGARREDLQLALLPAVLVEMTLDNTHGAHARKVFCGFAGNDPYAGMRSIASSEQAPVRGVGEGRRLAILSRDRSVHCAVSHRAEEILAAGTQEDPHRGTGGVGLLWFVTPAHRRQTVRFAVCFFREGPATAGLTTRYYYTDLFRDIEEAGAFALDHFIVLAQKAADGDARIASSNLSAERRFMLAQAIRTYFANTLLLLNGREPVWVVSEGEQRRMNTLDLAADHLFFEMGMNPWVVRNLLDLALARHSYHDRVCFPENPREYPGGIVFSRDMGVAGCFAHPGRSAFEWTMPKAPPGFLAHEELVNWICCAGVYFGRTGDLDWARKYKPLFMDLLTSLLHRDHPNPARRNGLMKLDTCLQPGVAESTTYVGLDPSLAQARNNLYLSVKTWAAYVSLEKILVALDLDRAASQAGEQARRCALTLQSRMLSAGFIPALIDEKNDARLLPAVEGLLFPYFAGWKDVLSPNGPYADLLQTLRRHMQTVLSTESCLAADGTWKLSSRSDAVWLSKVFLCQFVARQVLRLPPEKSDRAAEAAYAAWLTSPDNACNAWSDQWAGGRLEGGRFYPRGVTACLWLIEDAAPKGRRATHARA